jgi:hypothetical protein
MSAISAIVSLIGWRLPRRIGRPGAVTSTASAVSRAARSEPRRPAPRSASAPSMASRDRDQRVRLERLQFAGQVGEVHVPS